MLIIGKRWRDQYGNQYHTVLVNCNGSELRSGVTYGYGDQYLVTAHKLLRDAGLFAGDYSNFVGHLRKRPAAHHVEVIDVARRRDL